MKNFLESKEVFVVKGYLSSNKDKVEPIYNEQFVKAQHRANYIIKFAEMAKGRDFVGKEAESLSSFKAEVLKALETKAHQYVAEPKKVTTKLSDQLTAEALAFLDYQEDLDKVVQINNFMAQFDVLVEFEEIGLFFEQDIVKLPKIYTVKEITKAVESVIDLLN